MFNSSSTAPSSGIEMDPRCANASTGLSARRRGLGASAGRRPFLNSSPMLQDKKGLVRAARSRRPRRFHRGFTYLGFYRDVPRALPHSPRARTYVVFEAAMGATTPRRLLQGRRDVPDKKRGCGPTPRSTGRSNMIGLELGVLGSPQRRVGARSRLAPPPGFRSDVGRHRQTRAHVRRGARTGERRGCLRSGAGKRGSGRRARSRSGIAAARACAFQVNSSKTADLRAGGASACVERKRRL